MQRRPGTVRDVCLLGGGCKCTGCERNKEQLPKKKERK